MTDVNVPGVGRVPKTAVYGGVAVVVVLVILHYRNPGPAAAPAAGAGAYPPDGTAGNPADPNSVDPTSGITYGNEGIGSGAAVPAYGLGGGSGGSGSSGSSDGQQGPPFTDNAAWSQYAENYLTSTVGEDAGTVASALGAYLAGRPVTPAQKDIIDQAVGFAGNPPVTGPGGYPPSIRLASQPTGGGGPSSTVSGGRVVSVGNNDAVVAWTPHGPATRWLVKITGPNLNGRTSTVSKPEASYSGLAAGHNYQVTVTPQPSGRGGEIHFTTTRKK